MATITCTNCGKETLAGRRYCPLCRSPGYEPQETDSEGNVIPWPRAETSTDEFVSPPVPGLSVVFYAIALLALAGGFFLASELWPTLSYGQSPTTQEALPALLALTGGILQCAIYGAIGEAIRYLNGIYRNTRSTHH
jgi:hypothetical protein